MPKFPKAFGRRKSTANALEDLQNAPASPESSFKVLERPGHNKNSSFDGGIKLTKPSGERPTTSPLQRENNIFAGLGSGLNRDRDSGGSNSNTTSTFTTDNSSRLSAGSTAPSTHNSGEYRRHDERSSHPDRIYDLPAHKHPRPSSSAITSLKAAGRTFSFGKGKGTPPVREGILPPPPGYQNMGAGSSRGATTSSSPVSTYRAYAPPKVETQELGLNLGGDFSEDMFTNFKRKSVQEPNEDKINMRRVNDHDMAAPAKPLPAYSNNRGNPLPPLRIDRSRDIEPSPYSWASHDSAHRLITATPSPPPVAHMNPPPPVPPHGMLRETHSDNFASHARPQRPGGPIDSGLRRSTALKRRSTLELGDAVDEDAKLLRDSYQASRQLQDSYATENGPSESQRANLSESTPKQQLRRIPSVSSTHEMEDMFDPSIAENAILANQLSEQRMSPPPERPRNKIMTPAQFERAKHDQERLLISRGPSSKDDDDEDDYDEDEDEAERLKKIAKQRKLQDAHMAVFRQGMMKTTGETPSPLTNRPTIMSSFSTPNLILSGPNVEDDSDEDEDTPLAILKEHGFPNKNRQPSHASNMIPNNGIVRPSSQAGGAGSGFGGAGGNLPIFARNLPQDPYFGASIVNPLNREPLNLGSASGSARGGNLGGGLIGVIANEERNRAMRRGSPNASNALSSNGIGSNGMHHTGAGAMGMGIPSNTNMHPNMQMQQPMINPIGPMSMPMGPMSPMMNPMMNPMMAGQMMPPPPMGMVPEQTPQDQMDFMRMQMQMQMQWMQMMNGGMLPAGSPNGQSQQQRTSTMTATGAPTLQIPGIGSTPQRPGSSGGRAMSLMDVNMAPWRSSMPTNYTPSIAPSERSNVGLPGRYRPVSQAVGGAENAPLNGNNNNNNSRAPSLSGLNRWSNDSAAKAPSSLATSTTVKPTIRPVEREKDEREEDEEAGWKAMKAKREKKRGFWKEKKQDNEIKGMLAGFE